MQKMRQWAERFDAMSVRERGLILVTVLVALALPCYAYLIEPAQIEQAKLSGQLQQLKTGHAEAQLDFQLAKAAKVEDPNVALQQQIEQLQLQLQQQRDALAVQRAALVSPEQMVEMLEQVLKGHQGVKLLKVSKSAPVPIGARLDADATDSAASAGLYRHDLELQLEGRFFQVQGFLKAVETSGKPLFWNSLDYRVEDYPKARVRLQVYTLSTSREWLGV